MDRPINFNDRPPADDLRVKFFSSESSCRSMKSEPSLNKPMEFKERKREKLNPAAPSCVSLKSDRSMELPTNFNDRPPADDPRVKFFSSESSCRSMKSEPSLNKPKGIQTRK
ncbi:hypothetical protein DNTS_021449, partial [Danionella cerebrum]